VLDDAKEKPEVDKEVPVVPEVAKENDVPDTALGAAVFPEDGNEKPVEGCDEEAKLDAENDEPVPPKEEAEKDVAAPKIGFEVEPVPNGAEPVPKEETKDGLDKPKEDDEVEENPKPCVEAEPVEPKRLADDDAPKIAVEVGTAPPKEGAGWLDERAEIPKECVIDAPADPADVPEGVEEPNDDGTPPKVDAAAGADPVDIVPKEDVDIPVRKEEGFETPLEGAPEVTEKGADPEAPNAGWEPNALGVDELKASWEPKRVGMSEEANVA